MTALPMTNPPMTNPLVARFLAELGDTGPLVLAVSGGGDSMAMLHLAVEAGLKPAVVTVDHGLRAEAAAEALQVKTTARALGLTHETLLWRDWDGTGNLQDAARRARRRLIGAWAQGRAVALAHTADDVAETFLMRLARGAGLDGLSAMAARFTDEGTLWLRPLLWANRPDLRAYLQAQGRDWCEDPSNTNPRFDRVRARHALTMLAPLGLTARRLAEVASHLNDARAALEDVTNRASICLTTNTLTVTINPALFTHPSEIRRRLILRVIRFLAPADYGPRGPALTALLDRLHSKQPATLAGCRFIPDKTHILAFREAKPVATLRSPAHALWDNRWRITPAPLNHEIAALGAHGLAQCPNWRTTGHPRAALLSSPALWLNDQLIAAPFAAPTAHYSIIPLSSVTTLHQSAITD